MADKVRIFLRFVMVAFYIFAGAYHFIQPEFYLPLIPNYLPYPQLINYISGALEILFAFGVVFKKTRLLSVFGIILLLTAFIPAHIHFIQVGSCLEKSLCIPEWISWIRLLLVHPLLFLWVWKIRK